MILTGKWGNTASCEFGISFVNSNYQAVYYLDSTTTDDYIDFNDFIEDNNLEKDFREWFFNGWQDYDCVDCLKSACDESDGHGASCCYYTTSKPFDSPEWEEIFKDFEDYIVPIAYGY